jgi:hypothetical protein
MAQTKSKTDRDEITLARLIFDEIVDESEREETPKKSALLIISLVLH